MRDMEDYRKELFAKCPAYRLDCIVMDAVEDILKDIPEFAEYFSICHKQAEWEWKANYKPGRRELGASLAAKRSPVSTSDRNKSFKQVRKTNFLLSGGHNSKVAA